MYFDGVVTRVHIYSVPVATIRSVQRGVGLSSRLRATSNALLVDLTPLEQQATAHQNHHLFVRLRVKVRMRVRRGHHELVQSLQFRYAPYTKPAMLPVCQLSRGVDVAEVWIPRQEHNLVG